ncbi:hypothetical protein K227x_18300 [Rubripirellula lacrimiformis]|uniref:Uncharacterized protein n=1 Tax=Rubripirellula lacrimiformis TaxID=1930273 RepID=A0A517N8I0_9BACT|nr:hypothetical protein K227x_18300 [Rubripirellula lacrimiformis]
MPAALSFNRVGNAPRAPDPKRVARSARGETNMNDALREVLIMPAALSFNRVGNAPRAPDRKRAARWARG